MAVVKIHTLSNGLRVVHYFETTYSVYMTLSHRAGPRFESPEESGLGHIFEHLCVRKPELHREIELLGNGLWNADVDNEAISYYFSFPNRNVLKGVELFYQLWTAPVSAEVFEREMSVVGIEYVDESIDQDYVLDDLFMQTAWAGHPLGRGDIATWRQNASNLTFEQFLAFRQRVQCGRNSVLAVVGETPVEPLLEVLERTFGKIPAGEEVKAKKLPLPSPNGFKVAKRVRDFEHVHCRLGFALPKLKAAERLALSAFSTYFGDPELFSAVLFNRVRNDLGLVYYIWAEPEFFYDSAALKVSWTCAPENVELIMNVILEEILTIARNGMSLDEFRRAREVLYVKREASLEEPITLSMNLAEEGIESHRVRNPRDWVKQARSVQRAEITRLVREYLTPQRAVMALYGPVENITPRILI